MPRLIRVLLCLRGGLRGVSSGEALDVGSFDGKGEADVGAASPSRRFGSRLPPLPRIGRLRNPFA